MNQPGAHILILTPLYKDEAAFASFAAALEKITAGMHQRFSLLVVNDGTPGELQLKTKLPLTVIHLHINQGHQKAIAVGMAWACQHLQYDAMIVMDCDGEDNPSYLPALIDNFEKHRQVIVAKRGKRSEPGSFRFFYLVYRQLFRLLTGKEISFGNFMLLPATDAKKLIHHSEIWNHLGGTLIKSAIPYREIIADRSARLSGKSGMNFNALLLHGLAAISVFIERIASRLLVFSLVMIGISLLAILVVSYIRVFTSQAIPGWATTAFSSMLIVLLQSFLLSLFTIFLFLSAQGQRKIIPAIHFGDYIRSVETQNHSG